MTALELRPLQQGFALFADGGLVIGIIHLNDATARLMINGGTEIVVPETELRAALRAFPERR